MLARCYDILLQSILIIKSMTLLRATPGVHSSGMQPSRKRMAPLDTGLILWVRKCDIHWITRVKGYSGARSCEQRGGLCQHQQAGDIHPGVTLAGLDTGHGGGGTLRVRVMCDYLLEIIVLKHLLNIRQKFVSFKTAS